MPTKNCLKAYNDMGFLNSYDARTLRILSEYLEPAARFKKHSIKSTIVFFGSARTLDKRQATQKLKAIKDKISKTKKPSKELLDSLKAHEGLLKMVPYYDAAEELAYRFTKWSEKQKDPYNKLIVTSGGAGGIMCAANKGAKKAGGKSVGLNISLPFEQEANKYITPELVFEFHYFFMRKFWFVYLAKALIVFPGGFGTMDELMEALTLIQTKKLRKHIPIVIFGKKFWNEVINFEKLVEWGVISPQDLDLFLITDDIDEAFNYLTRNLIASNSVVSNLTTK